MAERDRVAQVERAVSRVLRVAEEIDNPVSRADALFLVWQAVSPASQKVRRTVLEPLLSVCAASSSWKGAYLLSDIALILARDDPTAAQEIVDAMAEGRYKQQAHRRINEDELMQPRPFYWR